MVSELILTQREGSIMWLTLNRPQEANALSIDMAHEFGAAIDEAEADSHCHVVVIQGEGKFFCAGGDVAMMASSEEPAEFLRELAETMHEGLVRLARSRLITVAVVHGPAAGAGLGIVLNADVVIASPSAVFLSAYATVGLTPDCGVSYLLPRVVGPRRAAQMSLLGRVVTADEALDWGLVTEVVAAPELTQRARELGEQLGGGANHILGPTKRLLTSGQTEGYVAHLADEVETISEMISHQQTQELLAAFVARSKK